MSRSNMSYTIKRKPVPVSPISNFVQPSVGASTGLSSTAASSTSETELVHSPSSTSNRRDTNDDSSILNQCLAEEQERLAQLQISELAPPTPNPVPSEEVSNSSRPGPVPVQPHDKVHSSVSPQSVQSSKSLPLAVGKAMSSAYGEVRHFAGGLISHPAESTKHYSILRHSHGLVYYTGSYTNLAITVFADRELPSDRTFWLQRKGWSGKTGMRAGALFGTHGAWVDVTPSMTATIDQLDPADERAWQRDIKKFFLKAPKKLSTRQIRETNVLRIPCKADDGYLRVVMCTGERGKKALCPSPVFRLASTSMSSSSIRGSSLSTLPIEAAVKVGTFAARQTANTFAGPYVETARTLMTSQITSVYQPSAIVETAATTAYARSGVPDKIEKMNDQYDNATETAHQVIEHGVEVALAQSVIVGDESGPQPPYPIRFNGKVVIGTGQSMATLGVPTANLVNVDNEVLLKYTGIYFGWAAVNLPKKLQDELLVDDDWHEAVISIIPDSRSSAKVVQKKVVRLYIIEDFEGAKFYDAKISVIMMSCIRPTPRFSPEQQPDVEADKADLYKDVASATISLARPAWKADETLERIRSAASNRSIAERYVDLRQSTQKQIDRVPTWKVGVRTDGAALKDRFVGNGGICIPR